MEASQLVLPTILLLTALALVMSGIAVAFQIRRDRLPDATRLENVRELRAREEQTLAERRAELSVVEQKIQQRDRLIAEVASLEERLKAIQAELALLDEARREIDEVKAEAASAAAELARISQELAEKRAELERVAAECDPARVAALRQDVERLTGEKVDLDSILPGLRAERDAALRIIEESRTARANDAARELERDRLNRELDELHAKREEVKDIEIRLSVLREETSKLQDDKQRLSAQRDELMTAIRHLQAEHACLNGVADEVTRQRDELEGLRTELGQKRETRDGLVEELTRLVARRAQLQSELNDARPGDGGHRRDEARRNLLADLLKIPACLEFPAVLRGIQRTEDAALQTVSEYLRANGLKYSTRTVHAFHTALKINDNAQLTVLAGVSGTGKSLLPRRYAEAMGMHFLQIAVEPRWDSPQDLLGFYNYIEKNYRATDLARVLLHIDPYERETPQEARNPKDHITLVLLDEMNLARVEYYFSEFLSRLEARPRYEEAVDELKRRDAKIPIDIRGLSPPISLYPAHNVLFAGTMNDDESTQALSDKVLDRGNILQFAAPREFPRINGANGVERPNEAQSFKSWRTWVRPNDRLEGAKREEVDSTIGKLAELMESCGRPFGHRLRDAIYAYVVNYPVSNVRLSLADQIEFRILPKLRGIEIHSHRPEFDNLEKLIREDLDDGVFADRLSQLCEQQVNGAGLFVWRGITREG